jgi:hypothetical protein
MRRGWVCCLQLLLALASVIILGSESRVVHDHILLPQVGDSPQPGGPGPCNHISQGQGDPIIPQAVGYSAVKSESELLYDWRFTVYQFVLMLTPLRLTACGIVVG